MPGFQRNDFKGCGIVRTSVGTYAVIHVKTHFESSFCGVYRNIPGTFRNSLVQFTRLDRDMNIDVKTPVEAVEEKGIK